MKKQDINPLPRGQFNSDDLSIYEKSTDITVKAISVGFAEWLEHQSPLLLQSGTKEELFELYIN